MLKIAVFGSGRGSNFRAILEAIRRGGLTDVGIRCVLSNNSQAGILELARTHDIPALHCSRAQFTRDEEFEQSLLEHLRTHDADFIALAGYMKRLPARIIAAYPERIVNIHPALLPKFGGQGMYGMRVHEAVLAARETESGATVHLVDEEYDHGAIVAQRKVPVLAGDTPDMLAARVLEAEHLLYPEALALFAEGRVQVHRRRVVIR
jgi:phosphoribosylglycinamide formyltransferase-1